MKNSKLQFKIQKLVKEALKEDVGNGDITTLAVIPKNTKAKGIIVAKEAGVIAGLLAAKEVFKQVDKRIKFSFKVKNGSKVNKGKVVAEVSGPARGILIGERVALNFLQRLSGIATLTCEFVKRARSTEHRAQILDTRKTTPGLRVFEKCAVRCGGGVNHRMGLYDAILIKDNHLKLTGGVKKAIKAIKGKRAFKGGKIVKGIEVEAKTIFQVKEAINAGVDCILLDNMNLKTLRRAVKLCKKAKIKTEASGGVNLKTVRAIAKTGVDYISVGALTHSAKALDISLEIID